MFKAILKNTVNSKPVIHCITNYVTINDCANIILAAGGSPIMAEDINEAAEVTALSKALVLNIGMLTQAKLNAMLISGKTANRLNIPVILDPVGAGVSKFRADALAQLLHEIKFSVIRGNISEIKALCRLNAYASGIDAGKFDDESKIDDIISAAKAANRQTNAVIAATGKTDVITNGEKTYLVHNGCNLMKKITGAGCMLTAVIACLCAANRTDILNSAAAAAAAFGLSGELAYKKLCGSGDFTASFKTYLIDFMSVMTDDILSGGRKIELR